MALSNYGELKTSIATLLNRSDLTAAIPDFIAMLEAQVNRDVRFRNRRQEASASVTFSSGSATLPTDFIEARTVVFQSDPRVRLEYMSPSAFENAHTSNTAGSPVNFTIVGDTLKLGPRPDTTTAALLSYYQRLPALSADSDTNWLLTYHPDVYLYGAALHSAPYLGEDSRLQTWVGLMENASLQVAGDDSRARWNGAPVRPQLSVTVV